MKLFAEKTSKFQSLVSISALCGMFVLFSLALPAFLASSAGTVFVVVWAATALLVFLAHARRLAVPERRFAAVELYFEQRKTARPARHQWQPRGMRG